MTAGKAAYLGCKKIILESKSQLVMRFVLSSLIGVVFLFCLIVFMLETEIGLASGFGLYDFHVMNKNFAKIGEYERCLFFLFF